MILFAFFFVFWKRKFGKRYFIRKVYKKNLLFFILSKTTLMKSIISDEVLRRIEIIAMVLEKSDYYTELDFVEYFNVSPQTIRADMEKIRRMGFDIHSRKSRYQGGKILPKLFNELICTYFAINKYDIIKNLGLIKKKFGKKTLNVFVKILKSINQRRVLRFGYGKNSHGETVLKTVTPVTLSRVNRNIYLFGCENDSSENLKVYLIERMSDITITENTSKIKDIPDMSEYLRTAWGAYTGGEEQNVKIRFSKETGDYIKDKFYIETQEFTEMPDHLIMTMKVKISYELISWIMGWGGEAEVLEPKSLQEEITKRAISILKLYK